MNSEKSSKTFTFKGTTFQSGDILMIVPAFGKTRIPDSGTRVAALEVDNEGSLIVFVPASLAMIANQWRILVLRPEHLESLSVELKAKEAILRHSGQNGFRHLESVATVIGHTWIEGYIIAALEECIVMKTSMGLVCTGGIRYFQRC